VSAPALRRVGDYLRGVRMKRQRESLNPGDHSIDAYAHRLGWPRSRVQQIETSRKHMVEPEELRALAVGYDVPYSNLVDLTGFLDPISENESDHAPVR
jgi:hypothetical protein